MKKPSRSTPMLVELHAGPFAGNRIHLHDSKDTLTILVNGSVGRYKDGQWVDNADEPAPVPQSRRLAGSPK